MDNKLDLYYQNRFAMFSSNGWKELMADVTNMYRASNALDGATKDNFEFKQGELNVMKWLLTLEQTTKTSYEGIENDESS